MTIESKNNGAIYGISLPKNLGFVYVKILHTDNFGNMVRVFDIVSPNLLTMEELNAFQPSDLTYRMMMMGTPRIRKYKDRLIWHFIGMTDLNDSDKIVPDFKDGVLVEMHEDWSKFDKWNVMMNMSFYNRVFDYGSYKDIIHLPLWIHSSYESITTRVTMFWLKKLNRNAEYFYTAEELEKDINIILGFREAKNSILYSEIPQEKWNKFLLE